ncbi:hypothetical protein Pint_12821 [Pistacia integerrima]|uniref:Uncharacterized protein n=1 Tax=Pistacia integerrima TaxID=434235 RepID=A0ACC0Y9K4_9ROSI|nr:hypothetical protein Pint_12821 [Pistacia integerrima]
MSSMWLLPHFVLGGLSMAFNTIGQSQFYYSELPKSMASISSSLLGIGSSAASLVSSFIMNIVDNVTKSGEKESWVSTNINKGHYDYYYWLLAGLSMANFMYFLVCSKAYGPCKGEANEKEDMKKQLGSSSDEKKMIKETLLSTPNPKGGFQTLPFIIANEAFERMASVGLMPNMILYLTREYGMETARGVNILFIWSAATNFMPVIGAFLADSYVGRYHMISCGSIASLLGMFLLWLTTIFPPARFPHCDELSKNCLSPTTSQLLLLYSSFGLMSIGAGGIRSSSIAFGADQLKSGRDNLNSDGILRSYFSWYYVSVSISAIISVTCIVYIQDKLGWRVGFGVPCMLMLLSAVLFFVASPFYVKLKAKESLLTGFAQVVAASYKNRHIELSSQATNEYYHYKKGAEFVKPTETLRYSISWV